MTAVKDEQRAETAPQSAAAPSPFPPIADYAFLSDCRARLRQAYPRRADGKTLLPFRRLFVVAQR